MATQKLNLTRDQLATFLKDHEQIRQFEALFRLADSIAPDVVTETALLAGNALAVANEANATLDELSQAVALLAFAPRQELGTLAPQNADAVLITGGRISGLAAPLPVSSGGTGQSSFTDGQLLIGNGTGGTLTKATLTAGANITITNGAGSISIAVSGLGSMAFKNVGVSGTFTTVDFKTVTVVDGIITSIV